MKITKTKLKSLLNKGMSVKEVAVLFDCTRQGIYWAAKRYGIKVKPKSKLKDLLCKKCTVFIENL